jgi:transposase
MSYFHWNPFLEDILLRARDDLELPWDQIGHLFAVTGNAAKLKYHALKKNSSLVLELGEKTVVNKSIVSSEIKRGIKDILLKAPKSSIRDIEAELPKRFPGVVCPKRTSIGKALKEMEFEKIKAIKKQFIRTANQEKRIQFCKEFDGTPADWLDLVVWSDETMIRKAPNNQDFIYWTRRGRNDDSMLINPQYQMGGFGVMFWGCMSGLGIGPLVVVEESMDRRQYMDIIGTYLIPYIKEIKDELGMEMEFMQDNAPCHKASEVTEYLRKKKISVLPWPPQSPDLNPIENLWHCVKQRRYKKYPMPSTKDELIEQVFEIWGNLEPELIEKLCSSAPRRFQACLDANGLQTKY